MSDDTRQAIIEKLFKALEAANDNRNLATSRAQYRFSLEHRDAYLVYYAEIKKLEEDRQNGERE